jgi:hypothetical protein
MSGRTPNVVLFDDPEPTEAVTPKQMVKSLNFKISLFLKGI